MNISIAMDWYREMLWTTIVVAAPPIGVGLIVGLFIAVFQAATQINDSVVSFAPKALAAAVTMIVAGPWMLIRLAEFTSTAIEAMAPLGK